MICPQKGNSNILKHPKLKRTVFQRFQGLEKAVVNFKYFQALRGHVRTLFVWVNVAFKHLRSYSDGVYLWQWYFDQCSPTQECHAADTGHDIQSRHRHGVDLSLYYPLM